MARRSADLHGNAPDKSEVALLLIDIINDLEFPEGEEMLRFAIPMARSILALKKRAKKLGIPVIYVNDNFGRWQSNFHAQIEHCLGDGVRGRALAELLVPDEDDYFVLKPKLSGFYSTTLDIVLEHLRAGTLIITGIAANICVLFTANDAYMRDYKLIVPGDCVASNTEGENRHALEEMAKVLKADIRPSPAIDLEAAVHGEVEWGRLPARDESFLREPVLETGRGTMADDPRKKYPTPPYSSRKQQPPGDESEMDPKPDYGEASYKGSGKLEGKSAIITGGDSGIGRAVALAFAREGADVLISYLSEEVRRRGDRPRGRGRGPEMHPRPGRHRRGGPLPGDHRIGRWRSSARSTSWSTTPPSRCPASRSRRSPPRSSTGRSRRTSTRCSG